MVSVKKGIIALLSSLAVASAPCVANAGRAGNKADRQARDTLELRIGSGVSDMNVNKRSYAEGFYIESSADYNFKISERWSLSAGAYLDYRNLKNGTRDVDLRFTRNEIYVEGRSEVYSSNIANMEVSVGGKYRQDRESLGKENKGCSRVRNYGGLKTGFRIFNDNIDFSLGADVMFGRSSSTLSFSVPRTEFRTTASAELRAKYWNFAAGLRAEIDYFNSVVGAFSLQSVPEQDGRSDLDVRISFSPEWKVTDNLTVAGKVEWDNKLLGGSKDALIMMGGMLIWRW